MKTLKTKTFKKVNTTYELVENILVLNETRENSVITSENIGYIGAKPEWEDGKFYAHISYVTDMPKFLEICKNNHFSHVHEKASKANLLVEKNYKSYFEENVIIPDNFIFFYSNGHMLFDYKLNPIPTVYHFDYISSFKEKYTNDKKYKAIIEVLKTHSYTVSLDEADIPYYNRSFTSQNAISLWRVYMPQDIYLKIWNRCIKSKYPTSSLKDIMSGKHINDLDIYGINNLLEEYNKEDEQSDEDSDEDDY